MITELEPYDELIHSALLYKGMGMEEGKASEALEGQSPDRDTFEFVEKTAAIIFKAFEEHNEKLRQLCEDNSEQEKGGEAAVVAYLTAQGISEKLGPYIHTYTLLIMARHNTELLIREAERTGISERQIIDQMQQMGFDRTTAITIYRVAYHHEKGELSTFGDHQRKARKHFLRALAMFVLAAVAFFGGSEGFIFIVLLSLGILSTSLAVYRFSLGK